MAWWSRSKNKITLLNGKIVDAPYIKFVGQFFIFCFQLLLCTTVVSAKFVVMQRLALFFKDRICQHQIINIRINWLEYFWKCVYIYFQVYIVVAVYWETMVMVKSDYIVTFLVLVMETIKKEKKKKKKKPKPTKKSQT
eukprot:TRINITY_DN3922_c1_g2_i1.p3 TRINITY_DN3922_c1_g2~~TRINITY_DN3922_c1_g2_i1.p3  ORF type:complete len:138 (+),score=6.80 TRINITY_DN3922_c1_g2_i1:203-616(+)